MTEQEPLFHVDATPVRKPTKKEAASALRPRWSKYRPVNPAKCDDCMAVLAETKGSGPVSRQAKWRRNQGSSDRLLCYAHAALQRAEDGLAPVEEP